MSDSVVAGRVHVIEETKEYGQNGFRKRLLVLEQDKERFTNYIPVEFIWEGCDSLDQLSVGDEIEISYRLSGRKWQRDPESEIKYFLNAEGLSYRLLKGQQAGVDPQAGFAPQDDMTAPAGNDAPTPPPYNENDIPF